MLSTVSGTVRLFNDEQFKKAFLPTLSAPSKPMISIREQFANASSRISSACVKYTSFNDEGTSALSFSNEYPKKLFKWPIGFVSRLLLKELNFIFARSS